MAFKIFDENSKMTGWQYIAIGIFLFLLGSFLLGPYILGGDLGRAIITIGLGPVIVGIVKLFKGGSKKTNIK